MHWIKKKKKKRKVKRKNEQIHTCGYNSYLNSVEGVTNEDSGNTGD